MKTLKVKLKQHTPLIHFQHDQYGATLRASEVKPKLDKYIIEHEFENNYEKCKYYLVGYKFSCKNSEKERKAEERTLNVKLEQKFKSQNYRALNYKLRIKSDELADKFKIPYKEEKCKFNPSIGRSEFRHYNENFPFVLSNMGGKQNKEELVNFSCSDSLELLFLECLDFDNRKDIAINNSTLISLSDIIEKYVVCFFVNHNFGQRATKGFGSFTVVEINDKSHDKSYEWIPGSMSPAPFFKYKQVAGDLYDRMKVLFNIIDFYWRCLKSGVNYTKRKKTNRGIIRTSFKVGNEYRYAYIKSYLWKYLNNRGYTWEKRKIKEDLSLIGLAAMFDSLHKENNNNCFFARGLMGCSTESIQYRIPRGEWELNKKNKESEKFDKVEVKISNSNTHNKSDKIERIASPIFFKPVLREVNGCEYVYVYILFDDNLIKKLNDVASDYIFNFSAKGSNVNMRLKPFGFSFDYADLIKSYHLSFYDDKDVFESIFRIPFDKRTDGHKFKMIARDSKWNNILDVKNENVMISLR